MSLTFPNTCNNATASNKFHFWSWQTQSTSGPGKYNQLCQSQAAIKSQSNISYTVEQTGTIFD